MDRNKVMMSLSLSLMLSSFFLLGYYFGSEPPSMRLAIMDSESSDYSMCENKSISSTALCLRNFVKTFYNYTVREDTLKSLEDVKSNGGDCYDYSQLYVRMANELGYDAKLIRISYNKTSDHAIAIISNKEGYCVMDQVEYSCKYLA